MSDPPPPSNPPPGWYPDPAKDPGYRWWDGQGWTETVTDDLQSATYPTAGRSEQTSAGSILGPVGPWFSESFRLTVNRSGHFLPMILIFVLSISIPTSFGIWYALQDTVITFDPETAVPDVDFGGSRAWLVAVIIMFPVSTILSFLIKASATRQAWAAQAEAPELWSESVREVLRRSGRVIPVSLGRTFLYWGLNTLFLLAVFSSPGFVLLLPVLLVVLFMIWIRFSFAGTVAVLGGQDDRPFAESWRLSGSVLWPLMGRLLLLAFVALNLVLASGFIGAPLTAIVGGPVTAVERSADTLRFNELLGPNAAVFALGSVFNAIGLGANYILSAVGTALLYRNLGGPVSDRREHSGGTTSADGDSADE